MAAQFEITRDDGRSDAQVIFDFTENAKPGSLFSHDELAAELQKGLDAQVTKQRGYAAVASANRRLLRERNRYLRVVRGQGYRVIESSEHLGVALTKKDRAAHYIRKGKEILDHTDLADLTPAQRAMHEGQLFVLSGLLDHMRESNRRHSEQERVLDELKKRVAKLETT